MINSVIFICGAGGDAGMTYVPALKEFCESFGMNFYAPHMPGFDDGITYEKYKSSFEQTVAKIADLKNTLVIGQSIGTNFVVKYLAENPINIAGYISVSALSRGFDKPVPQTAINRVGPLLNSFGPTKEQYKKFKSYSFPKFSIYGGKDCFFTKANLENYANLIGAKKYYDPDGVHCTISENITEHKLLHKVIKENFCK